MNIIDVAIPYVLDETEDFAVVYKPARMHCAGGTGTLFDWYAAVFPPVKNISGRKEGEGGLLHRLDFETQGLVLFAKNQKSMDHLLRQQNEGKIIKEYNAVCTKAGVPASFPPPPFDFEKNGFPVPPFFIESFFRAYGPGRKQVRPVVNADPYRKTASDRGRFFRTEITGFSAEGDNYALTARLCRGFRHQIRCHLAWTGCPVLNDPLYGQACGQIADGFLALRATGLFFTGPGGGRKEYRIR